MRAKQLFPPRIICYLVNKVESGWWPRLLKKEGKAPVFLKVD
jgi:cytosolic prostaglandin-E synthase